MNDQQLRDVILDRHSVFSSKTAALDRLIQKTRQEAHQEFANSMVTLIDKHIDHETLRNIRNRIGDILCIPPDLSTHEGVSASPFTGQKQVYSVFPNPPKSK